MVGRLPHQLHIAALPAQELCVQAPPGTLTAEPPNMAGLSVQQRGGYILAGRTRYPVSYAMGSNVWLPYSPPWYTRVYVSHSVLRGRTKHRTRAHTSVWLIQHRTKRRTAFRSSFGHSHFHNRGFHNRSGFGHHHGGFSS